MQRQRQLFAFGAEIVNVSRNSAASIYSDVKVFVYYEVVVSALPDDAKVVHERVGEWEVLHIRVEIGSSDTRALVFLSGRDAHTADSLRIELSAEMYVVTVHGG